jgi:hypothetical protein
MVVNLILRYEKINGTWIEYIIPLFIHDSMYKMWWLIDAITFWRWWYCVYSLDGVDGSQGASGKNKLKKNKCWCTQARADQRHMIYFFRPNTGYIKISVFHMIFFGSVANSNFKTQMSLLNFYSKWWYHCKPWIFHKSFILQLEAKIQIKEYRYLLWK